MMFICSQIIMPPFCGYWQALAGNRPGKITANSGRHISFKSWRLGLGLHMKGAVIFGNPVATYYLGQQIIMGPHLE